MNPSSSFGRPLSGARPQRLFSHPRFLRRLAQPASSRVGVFRVPRLVDGFRRGDFFSSNNSTNRDVAIVSFRLRSWTTPSGLFQSTPCSFTARSDPCSSSRLAGCSRTRATPESISTDRLMFSTSTDRWFAVGCSGNQLSALVTAWLTNDCDTSFSEAAFEELR